MNTKEPQIDLAEIMARIEEMLNQHYSGYAEKFLEYQKFWNQLAKEELEHAQWIRQLYSESKKGRLLFNEKRFNKESLEEFLKQLEGMLTSFRVQSRSIKDALSNSLSIEKFVLEGKFLEVFHSDSPELKTLLQRLEEATLEHRNRIEQLSNQCR